MEVGAIHIEQRQQLLCLGLGGHHLQKEDELNPIVLHLRQVSEEEDRLTELLYLKPLGHLVDPHSHY